MELKQFPYCCGMGMLVNLSVTPRMLNRRRVEDRRDAIQVFMDRARARRMGKILAITAPYQGRLRYTPEGYNTIVDDFVALGWQEIDSYTNPNSSNIVRVWMYDLTKKEEAPKS